MDWLELARPKLAVISCGAENPYGRPSPQILNLFEEQAIPFRRTDVDGTVRVVSEGQGWNFDPTKEERP